MNGFMGAVAFLTRVPVPGAGDERALAPSVPWFPVVGGLVGLTTGLAYGGAGELLAPLPAAALAVTFQLVVTGALHEDGLADVADAVGGSTVAERQRILHDPSHGTYGVLALVASVVLRVALVASLGAADAVAALVAGHALGRGGAVALMSPAPPDTTGMAARLARDLGVVDRVVAMAGAATVGGLALGLAGELAVAPLAVVLAAGSALGVVRWGRRALGGASGDVLGAVEQVTEVAVLAALAATGAS